VVHFPVVLLLLGAPLALAAIFLPRCAVLAAVVLVLGAAGAVVAVNTGEREKRYEIAVPEGAARQVLREHERSGERARNAALPAALLAGAGCIRWRRKRVGRLLLAAAAVCAVGAAWQVAGAGKTGGQLVYDYGVGLRF
jgi:uncharacterized membrane protein